MKAAGWRWAVLLASMLWLGWMGQAQTNLATGTNTVVMALLTNGVKSNIGLLVPVGPEPMAPGSFSGDLRRMKAAWQQRLVLGPGDVVSFMVYGKPELTRPDVQVEPDGRITYLEAQGMMATGLTISELRELTEKELSKSYRNPRVMVVPTSWKSKKFHILGKVVNKGTYLLDRPLTVIEAVAQAAGLETGLFQLNTVELADLPRSFLIRRGQRVPVDFDRLFLRGDLTQNILLEPDDYLYFPSASANEVYILGEIGNPGAQGLTSDATALSVVTLAGGFTPRAYRQKILIVRGSLKDPQTFVVDLAAVLSGRSKDFKLEPRDIVYVASKPWARAEELLDMATSGFIQAMVTVWTGGNIGPFITQPILPSIK
jgi:protein involved in polysaccharide export with SLBB domain